MALDTDKPSRLRHVPAILSILLLTTSTVLAAAPTREDVFRSIQDNVSGPERDATWFLYGLFGLIGLIIIGASIAQYRRKRAAATPKSRNHQGKLIREILRVIPLKSRELKQLKIVADNTDADRPLVSPLTLILCPSVMAKTIQTKRLRVDRRALMSVARKAGLQVTRK